MADPRSSERSAMASRKLLPFDVLEDQEERAVIEISEVGRRSDVGVLDVGGGHGLALEPGDDFGQAAHLRVKDLEGEALVHVGMLGQVDRTHATLADDALDPIAATQNDADERSRTARAGVTTLAEPFALAFPAAWSLAAPIDLAFDAPDPGAGPIGFGGHAAVGRGPHSQAGACGRDNRGATAPSLLRR
jgi:hypothetical protein